MLELTHKQRVALKTLLVLSVVASVYLGLKGVFIDLYNPGSPVARWYSDVVNWMFIGTLIISIPLLVEKFQRLSKWHDQFNALPLKEQHATLWKATKPFVKQAITLVVLIVLASILISWYWQIPPEVMTNYQSYYSRPAGIGNINISEVNNITVINMTLKR